MKKLKLNEYDAVLLSDGRTAQLVEPWHEESTTVAVDIDITVDGVGSWEFSVIKVKGIVKNLTTDENLVW